MYSIIAKWDDNLTPSSVNNMATESESQATVKALIDKGSTAAFYFKDESSEGQECWRMPQHWVVNAEEKTAAIDQDSLDAAILSINMAELRAERNKRLAATDIIVLPDRWANMDDDTKDAWSGYRQQLRDLPANSDTLAWASSDAADLDDITWPTEPS